MTVDEFLAWEPGDGRAWQLVDGEPQAMSPARISDLNIEQQAASVADNYLVQHDIGTQHGTGSLRDYEALIPFLPMARPLPLR